jgi:hypothetical protein
MIYIYNIETDSTDSIKIRKGFLIRDPIFSEPRPNSLSRVRDVMLPLCT